VQQAGCEVLLVDCGIRSSHPQADITADEVAAAAGEERTSLAQAPARGPAVMAMTRGVMEVVLRLHAEGRLDGVAGVGGSGGSAMIAAAMQALPVGVPKLLVSTVASGDTRPYVGTSDIAMLYSVVDIAGLNQLSERILANAAGAIAGMTRAAAAFRSSLPSRPVVAATMYGVTTPCVETARIWLEDHGYEVLVFHATGSGGRAMETLVRSGLIGGVLDITTSELTDEVVGGAFSAGPDRLDAAAAAGIPQVVSLGAAEMGTFGPPETVPERYRDRHLYRHNDAITLMRIDTTEAERVGRYLARKLNAATGPVSVFIPAGGFSALSVPGAVFHDPQADAALVAGLLAELDEGIDVRRNPHGVNEADFAIAMAERLDALMQPARDTVA
jgi:uncharacterized protein (UPF0261 family)